jgi:outer membrane protein TolC
VASLEGHVRDVRALLEQRQAQQSDLLAANVAFSNARYQEAQATNRLDVARAEYNRLLGRPLEYPVQLLEPEPPRLEGDLAELTRRALAQRPELSGLALQSKSISEQAGAARAENKPRVELVGEYAFEENRYRDPEGIAAVGLMVSWNVLDGGRSRNQAAAMVEQSASVEMIRSDLESSIRLEVRRAWLDYWEAQRRMGISSEALVQADENLRVSRQNYAAGFATNTEVLNAVTYRAESQRDCNHAVYDAVLAALRIRRAAGELK